MTNQAFKNNEAFRFRNSMKVNKISTMMQTKDSESVTLSDKAFSALKKSL